MRFKIKILTLLFLITILGAFLRFYKNADNPPSLNIDEVSIGYNAYSILKIGKDEHGAQFPLSFQSVGDYKPPVLIYLTVPSIAIFGLNEFAIRFPAALMGTLLIPFFYLLVRKIFKNVTLALIAATLLSISPWHIYYSRYATESSMAVSFLILGIFFLYKLIESKWTWSIPAAFFLVLSMYTYHTERLFVPVFIVLFIFLHKENFLKYKSRLVSLLVFFAILFLPLSLSLLFGPDKTRAESTFITTDISFYREVLARDEIDRLEPVEYISLFFFWIRKFLNYFQPSFFFYNGLNMTLPGSYGLGLFYLFELPFLVFGFVNILKLKNNTRFLLLGWILLGLLPASLTHSEQHSLRTLIILPSLIIISAVGALSFFRFLITKKHYLARFALVLFLGFIGWNLLFALIVYTVHFPRQRGEAFMEGTKQVVLYALAHKDEYQEIIFDPVRGVEGPFTVSVPHMYILFYSSYDPKTYQNESKVKSDGSFGFNKFVIREIDWRTDRDKKGTLFIGSPWSLPEKDLKQEQILERVYLSSGDLAFFIVGLK